MSSKRLLTQPDDWWAAFEEAAQQANQTLAAWMGDAAKAKLPKEVRSKLSKRRPAHRPKGEKE